MVMVWKGVCEHRMGVCHMQVKADDGDGDTELDDRDGDTEPDDGDGDTEVDVGDGDTELDDGDGDTELDDRQMTDTGLDCSGGVDGTKLSDGHVTCDLDV